MKREELTALGIEGETLEQVMALHGRDVEKHKAAAGEWQKKYEEETVALRGELTQRDANTAAEKALQNVRFSSKSAQSAFMQALRDKALPVQDGILAGFDDFLAEYRRADEEAFLPENAEKLPVFTQKTTTEEPNDGALRAAFGL